MRFFATAQKDTAGLATAHVQEALASWCRGDMRFFATAQKDTARFLAERCAEPGASRRPSWSAEREVAEGQL